MAQYLVLIYENEEAWARADAQQFEQIMKDHQAFGTTNAQIGRAHV